MANALSAIPLSLSTEVGGVRWGLYAVAFDTAEGSFVTYIYAVSAEHASHVVEELRATARLAGQVVEVSR